MNWRLQGMNNDIWGIIYGNEIIVSKLIGKWNQGYSNGLRNLYKGWMNITNEIEDFMGELRIERIN